MKPSRSKVAIVLTFLTLIIVLNINAYQIAKTNITNTEKSVTANSEVLSGNDKKSIEEIIVEEIKEPEVIEEVVIEDPIVYDGMTLNQLGEKLERSLNSTLDGQGYNFASYAISLGLDPYLALAIVLEETGCTWECSYLVKTCNNIGGQKGSGCGSYTAYESIDAGIYGFLDNIYNNYYLYGLTTAELMNPKYAENPAWSGNVNAYIEKIRNA